MLDKISRKLKNTSANRDSRLLLQESHPDDVRIQDKDFYHRQQQLEPDNTWKVQLPAAEQTHHLQD